MGRGDQRTKRGKIAVGSYGKSRPRGKKKSGKAGSPATASAPAAPAES